MTAEQKREYDRKWRADNPDKTKLYRDRWFAKHPHKRKEYARRSRHNNPDAWKAYHLKHKYGLTPEDKETMLKAQDHKCAICGEHMDDPHIDHVKTPFLVRGLLCHNCNVAIGLMKDNPTRLRSAAVYLEKFLA